MRSYFFLIPFYILVFLGVTLPSDGNHGILSPKTLFFCLSFASIFSLFIFRGKVTEKTVKLVASFLGAICFLLMWFYIGSINEVPYESTFDQFKIFLITLFVVFFAIYLVQEKIMTSKTFIKFIIYSNFFYCLTKVLLVIAHLIGIINLFDTLEKLGFRFMSMAIIKDLGRLQTSVDIITPYLLFFVLNSDANHLNFSKRFKVIFQIVAILSILLSFSRFLLGIAFFCYLLHWFCLNKDRLLKAICLGLFVAFCAVMAIGPDVVYEVIEQRFFSNANYHSDLTRKDQIDALMETYSLYPYFGLGLGGFTKNYLRDDVLTHSYEVQWVGFLMQFGFFGIILLCIPIFFLGLRFFSNGQTRQSWAYFFLYICWISSGFTNPYLISLTSGIVYSIFYLIVNVIDNANRQKFIQI